ncbi:MAG: tRNA (adenosine(37)-N6)-threonylcarbamoyltransferase complex ATPase subunit type 1 TsaE [Actinomycetaceae bacterium]|nr:tRNA (adenosine(37)-N6)-threonylcarbamoyltransferase complex ATPase subunit type 1 TsaE [Actinomycetaceae bacterium]
MFTLNVTDPAQTQTIGETLARYVRGGDLIMLTGDLGTGKTTLTQGLGRGLGVTGRVASPTFIIARVHPNPSGPDLVHVDAYRITDLDDLETLDLDTALDESVIVVEWGEGKTETLSTNRLEIILSAPAESSALTSMDEADDGRRTITVSAIGPRWEDVDLEAALESALGGEEHL